MRKILIPSFFALFLLIGYQRAVSSWGGKVFIYLGEQRSPAAVRSLRDYSSVERRTLLHSVHRQMLEEAKFVAKDGYVGLYLKHPMMRSERGLDFACSVGGRPGLYDRIELTFIGEGISESGSQPRMLVESECTPGNRIDDLSVIWIPFRDIITAPAKDQEMQIFGDHPVTLRLEQIPDSWPNRWVLWNVRLFRQANPDDHYVIDSNKIRQSNAKLMSFDWPQGQN